MYEMKMKNLRMIFAALSAVVLAGCASSNTDGLAVGKVSNTECDNLRQTRTDGDMSHSMIKLTREGNNIVCELQDVFVSCHHGDLSVNCRQDGPNLDISVVDSHAGGDDEIATNCACYVNFYFTIYDAEGDDFVVSFLGQKYNVSFKEKNYVEIDRNTGVVAPGGFEYKEKLDSFNFYLNSEGEYDESKFKPFLRLELPAESTDLGGHYEWRRMPSDLTKIDVTMDVEADGTLVFRLTHDGTANCESTGLYDISFHAINLTKDSYRVKVNPHKEVVKDADGTTHEETVCDFDGTLNKGDRKVVYFD